MSNISNKKKKFIKKNYEKFSVEELSHKTGLKPQIIRSIIAECRTGALEENPYASEKEISSPGLLTRRSIYTLSLLIVFICLFTCILYTPALNNELVYDDRAYISENLLIRSLDIDSLYVMLKSFSVGNWHPLTTLSYAIDYAFWELDPRGYHLTNIILHGINTLLVFILVVQLILKAKTISGSQTSPKRLLSVSEQAMIVAGVTALLFGVHPLRVEAVAWISERKELLCTFFFLLSILAYLSYSASLVRRLRVIWFSTSLFLFICALMSKPMAVTLPLILLLLDIYPLKRFHVFPVKNASALVEKIPFLALSIVSGVVTIFAQHSGGAIGTLVVYPLDTRLLNALRSLVFYLGKMIAPMQLVPFYPFPKDVSLLHLQYLTSVFLVFFVSCGCIWMVKRGRYLLFTIWAYYIITLLPTLGIIQVGMQSAADRYTYLPGLSVFLLAGIGVSWVCEKSFLTKHKNVLRGVVLIVICISIFLLCKLTTRQIKVWQNPESLWSYVVRVFPDRVSFPHYNLGNIYNQQGFFDQAISEYKRALAIRPDFEDTLNNLGVAYMRQGNFDEAISEYKKALAINPDSANAYYNLGTVNAKRGLMNKAISQLKKAITLNPNHAGAHYNLGMAYYQYGGNYKLAIVHLDKALSLGYTIKEEILGLLKPYR